MHNKRREFLKNTVIGGMGVGFLKTNSLNSADILSEDLLCETTTKDYYGEGPFYTDQPPLIENNLLASETEAGERVIISGRVFNLDCSEYIPNTIVDVWQANDAGQYDNNAYNLRGYTLTNALGFYLFETIRPGKYLNGSKFRPSHIHFKIKPPGFPLLTTQLYFEGDTDIADDAAASITDGQYDASERIISLQENSEGKLEGQFDIVISGNGIAVGIQDLHLNTGMIYSAAPNPVDNHLEIKYGVFKKAKVGIIVYDIQGKQVAILEDRIMTPEKYSVTWLPSSGIAAGHYFIAIKINDLQVHYLKVIKG
jgi:protocatechuate 3,4-dioxygenase beta subunit